MAESLREIIDNAAAQVSTYRNPNVSQARESLSEVLAAAGLHGIGQSERIDSIDEDDGTLCVRTSFVLRGCECTDEYELPSSIIDAADPVAAARAWGRAKRIREAEEAVAEARAVLQRAEKKLADACAETARADEQPQ